MQAGSGARRHRPLETELAYPCGEPTVREIKRAVGLGEKGIRLAWKMQVGPCIAVAIQLYSCKRLKLAQLLGQLKSSFSFVELCAATRDFPAGRTSTKI